MVSVIKQSLLFAASVIIIVFVVLWNNFAYEETAEQQLHVVVERLRNAACWNGRSAVLKVSWKFWHKD